MVTNEEPEPRGRFPRELRLLIRGHLLMFGAGMVMLGLSQAFSPARWDSPIYEEVYVLGGPRVWAVVFCAVGLLKLAAATRWTRFALAALVCGSLIIGWWAFAFIISTFTDPRFPPTGAVAWLWLLGGHLGIAALFDSRWGSNRAIRG